MKIIRKLSETELDCFACRYCELRQAAEYVIRDDEGVTAICSDCLDGETPEYRAWRLDQKLKAQNVREALEWKVLNAEEALKVAQADLKAWWDTNDKV